MHEGDLEFISMHVALYLGYRFFYLGEITDFMLWLDENIYQLVQWMEM